MSKASDAFENEIVYMVNCHAGEHLPYDIPVFLVEEGVRPGARILGSEGIGSKDKKNKTDVIIYLEESEPIKISAKLRNAHNFGNWYGHKRFLIEFGEAAFYRMTAASTKFANNWARTASVPYVGVSICFGKRSGRTGQDFTEIFTTKDILTVAQGYGKGNHVANCMYIANHSANTIPRLLTYLQAITTKTVIEATDRFKVAHRPVNPMTETSNRGKNSYTRFLPYTRLPRMTTITNPRELFELGEFVEVEPDCINHNHILNDLEGNYNIRIPRKGRDIEG